MRRRRRLLAPAVAVLGFAIAASSSLPQEVRGPTEADILFGSMDVAKSDRGAYQPSVAVDEKGVVHVAFVADSEVRIASCPGDGKAFGESRLVAETPGISCGMRRGPRLVASEGALVVSWISPPPGALEKAKTKGPDLVTSRSADGGATWSPPARVNKDPGVCGEGLHALAAGPGKTVYAVWNQPFKRGKPGMGTRLARSDDAGTTWALETWVYDPPSGTVCECCHPSVAVSPSGSVAVMFRNELEGARDMYVVESKDSGKTFGKARKLGTRTWKLPTCPMDGGGMAFGDRGWLLTAWRHESRIYHTEAGLPDRLLADGEQPWVGGVPGGRNWVVWSEPDGKFSATSLESPSEGSSLHAANHRLLYPVVAGSRSGTVFAAWEAVPGGGPRPFIQGQFLARAGVTQGALNPPLDPPPDPFK